MSTPRLLLLGGIVLVAAVRGLPVARAEDPPAPLDLARVEGAERFPGSEADRTRLARDGFLVLPRLERQIFSPYIGGDLPYYVTTDSAHHTYHVVFEQALHEVERVLARRGRDLLRRLAIRLAAAVPTTPFLRDEAWAHLRAHLEVALRLLGDPPATGLAREQAVAAEVALITGAAGRSTSPLSREPEDYALYLPRGLYAGSPGTEAWFRAATWLGRRGFRVIDRKETAAAALLVRVLREEATLAADLEAQDAVLGDFVGPADDLTAAEYRAALEPILGADPSDAALEAALPRIQAVLAALRDPEINASVLSPEDWRAFRSRTKGLRLMPSRLTPDGWLFQALAEADPSRALPSGLEVATALGSARSPLHLATAGETGARAAAHARERAPEFRRRLGGTHYGASLAAAGFLLDAASPLLGAGEAPEGGPGTPVLPAPVFRTAPWHDRLLATGLSAWAAVRHAWVLHAKTTVHYLGLTQDPPGVVEPEPRFYRALADLAREVERRAETIGAFRRDPKEALAEILPLLEALARDGTLPEADFERLLAHEQDLERIFPGDADPRSEAFRDRLAALRAWFEGRGSLDEPLSRGVEGLGTSEVVAYLQGLVALLGRLAEIAEKELRGEALSEEEEEFVREYGKTIAGLHGFRGNSWLSPDRTMGFVASVGSDPQRGVHRQVAVGPALVLYVALPIRGGGHRLYQGAVYSPYEFDAPAPLADDEWRERIDARRLPPPPAWTASYVAWADPSDLAARIRAGQTPEAVESLADDVIGGALLDALATAPVRSEEDLRRVQWLLAHLAAYGRGPHQAAVLDACLAVLARPLSQRGADAVRGAAAEALAAATRPQDRPRLLGLLRRPPEGAPEVFSDDLASSLLQMAEPPTAAEVAPLLDAPEPRMRRRAVNLLAGAVVSPGAELSEADRTRLSLLVERLPSESDAGVALTILDALLDAARLVAPEDADAVAGRLGAPEPSVRARAAELLGRLGSARHAPDLLRLLADPDDDVAAAAARALGRAIGVKHEDAALRARAIAALADLFPARGWGVSVASIQGLAALGDATAAEAVARIALGGDVDPRFRSIALEALADMAEHGIPHLFRLAFDETETGHVTDGHRRRLCDDAAAHLDDLHYDRFGWPDYGVPPPEDLARILEAIRAEARRLGHVK